MGHLCLKLPCKAVLVFVVCDVAELEKCSTSPFHPLCSKMVLFYLSRLDSCFFNLILIVFDVLNYVRSGQSESVDGSYQAQVCRVLGWHPSLMPKDEANEGAIKFFFSPAANQASVPYRYSCSCYFL